METTIDAKTKLTGAISLRLDVYVDEALQEECDESGTPKALIIRRVLREYIRQRRWRE